MKNKENINPQEKIVLTSADYMKLEQARSLI